MLPLSFATWRPDPNRGGNDNNHGVHAVHRRTPELSIEEVRTPPHMFNDTATSSVLTQSSSRRFGLEQQQHRNSNDRWRRQTPDQQTHQRLDVTSTSAFSTSAGSTARRVNGTTNRTRTLLNESNGTNKRVMMSSGGASPIVVDVSTQQSGCQTPFAARNLLGDETSLLQSPIVHDAVVDSSRADRMVQKATQARSGNKSAGDVSGIKRPLMASSIKIETSVMPEEGSEGGADIGMMVQGEGGLVILKNQLTMAQCRNRFLSQELSATKDVLLNTSQSVDLREKECQELNEYIDSLECQKRSFLLQVNEMSSTLDHMRSRNAELELALESQKVDHDETMRRVIESHEAALAALREERDVAVRNAAVQVFEKFDGSSPNNSGCGDQQAIPLAEVVALKVHLAQVQAIMDRLDIFPPYSEAMIGSAKAKAKLFVAI